MEINEKSTEFTSKQPTIINRMTINMIWTQFQYIHSQFNFLIQCLYGKSMEGYGAMEMATYGSCRWVQIMLIVILLMIVGCFEVNSVDFSWISIGPIGLYWLPIETLKCTFGRRFHPFPGRFRHFWRKNDPYGAAIRPNLPRNGLNSKRVFFKKINDGPPYDFFWSKNESLPTVMKLRQPH